MTMASPRKLRPHRRQTSKAQKLTPGGKFIVKQKPAVNQQYSPSPPQSLLSTQSIPVNVHVDKSRTTIFEDSQNQVHSRSQAGEDAPLKIKGDGRKYSAMRLASEGIRSTSEEEDIATSADTSLYQDSEAGKQVEDFANISDRQNRLPLADNTTDQVAFKDTFLSQSAPPVQHSLKNRPESDLNPELDTASPPGGRSIDGHAEMSLGRRSSSRVPKPTKRKQEANRDTKSRKKLKVDIRLSASPVLSHVTQDFTVDGRGSENSRDTEVIKLAPDMRSKSSTTITTESHTRKRSSAQSPSQMATTMPGPPQTADVSAQLDMPGTDYSQKPPPPLKVPSSAKAQFCGHCVSQGIAATLPEPESYDAAQTVNLARLRAEAKRRGINTGRQLTAQDLHTRILMHDFHLQRQASEGDARKPETARAKKMLVKLEIPLTDHVCNQMADAGSTEQEVQDPRPFVRAIGNATNNINGDLDAVAADVRAEVENLPGLRVGRRWRHRKPVSKKTSDRRARQKQEVATFQEQLTGKELATKMRVINREEVKSAARKNDLYTSSEFASTENQEKETHRKCSVKDSGYTSVLHKLEETCKENSKPGPQGSALTVGSAQPRRFQPSRSIKVATDGGRKKTTSLSGMTISLFYQGKKIRDLFEVKDSPLAPKSRPASKPNSVFRGSAIVRTSQSAAQLDRPGETEQVASAPLIVSPPTAAASQTMKTQEAPILQDSPRDTPTQHRKDDAYRDGVTLFKSSVDRAELSTTDNVARRLVMSQNCSTATETTGFLGGCGMIARNKFELKGPDFQMLEKADEIKKGISSKG